YEYFEPKKWYKFKMRVEPDYITCWIDDKKVVDVNIKDREIGMRPGDIELCAPLGLATFQTRVEYRKIVWRPFEAE
ncbi:MAG: family 16 glycoside hydrolase, partial [Verrucomicrobiota bacterium]